MFLIPPERLNHLLGRFRNVLSKPQFENSHDYVTGLYLCGDICLPSSARYGNPKKCNEKGIPFRTKIELCNEIIGHRSIARKTVTLIDSWYTGNEVISNCRKRAYGWIGDLRPNRVTIYDGKCMNVSNLLNILRKRGQFTDTVIDDQIYQTVKVMAYIPSLRENVSIVINAKADTKDVHVLCTDLQHEDVSTIFRYARKRVTIENSYKDAKQLGFGEYRFRKSEAALIHALLVFLAYILLQILRYRLSYRITKGLPSMEFVMTWVRKKTRHGFIHYICDKLKQGTSIRSLIMTVGKIDTNYV